MFIIYITNNMFSSSTTKSETPANGTTSSNFFLNMLAKINVKPWSEDETRKLTYLIEKTGRIVEMIPVFGKIGTAVATLAKMKINIDALKNISENVVKPIEQLQKTLRFFAKMNEITKKTLLTAKDTIDKKLETSKKDVIDDVAQLEKDKKELIDEQIIIQEIGNEMPSKMTKLITHNLQEDEEDMKYNEKEIKDETEEIAKDATEKRDSLQELINMIDNLSIKKETIEDIQKNLEKILTILTDDSILSKIVISSRDKINEIDVIMKSIENKLHALSFNYTSFTLFMTSNLGKIDDTLPSKFFNTLFETQEFKNFASSSSNDMTPTKSSTTLPTGADAISAAAEAGGPGFLARGGSRIKRKKSRGKKRTTRRHRQKLREPRLSVLRTRRSHFRCESTPYDPSFKRPISRKTKGTKGTKVPL
jgi:hypothetical protein